MPRHKKKKLVYKFLSFILPFIFLSIVATSLILTLTNYRFFQKTINQDYRNIIKSSAGEIRLFMDNARRNLESLALMMASTKLDPWQKEIALTSFLHTHAQFVSIDLVSGSGEQIVSTISDNSRAHAVDPEIFKRALSGKVAISNVMLAENDIPHVHVAVPIFHLGKVDEILWAQLNLKSIWDVLEGINVGETGQVFILNLAGRYIAHREIDRVVRTLSAENPEVLKKVKNSEVPVEWNEEREGRSFYNLGAYVPGLDWVVVLSQPDTEIYAYLYRNIYWAIILTLSVCVVAILFGWSWVRRFLVPVQTLHRQVQIIGQGDLDRKVSIKTEDEIGELGMAFNEMTDSLKQYIAREVETAKTLEHTKNLAILGTASSKVTHEVGNFLHNTDMALSGLQREALSQRGERILKIIENESGRVKEFIQKFLQFAKKPELHRQKSPLDLILREILTIIEPEAGKKGILINLNWDPKIPLVNVDVGLMSQVLNNLIKNSIEAISGDGKITISGRMEAENLVISVEDTGAGIDAENVKKIFDPFFTTKGTKGTGLGMSIVKTNVEAHGGRIECRSVPGQGTTFVIRLPVD